MQSAPSTLVNLLEVIGLVSSIILAYDLGFECNLSAVQARVLDLASYQKCSYAGIVVTIGRYLIFDFVHIWSYSVRRWVAIYKHRDVLKLSAAAHGLIADIFILSFSFALYEAPRPSKARLTLTTINTLMNLTILIYYVGLRQIIDRYLFNVWLATFQDDWSAKTHNKWWWIFLRCLGQSTPDTAFKDALVRFARIRRWFGLGEGNGFTIPSEFPIQAPV